MSHLLASVAANAGFRIGLVTTAFGFGLRHGIDWDHIAALTDITNAQESSRRSMLLATMYALGHGLVVLILGVAAIVLSERLPESVDGAMERIVGFTLLVLGIYVLVALARHGRDFRMRSRWMLIFAGARRGARWLRGRARPPTTTVVITHEHDHPVDEPHEHDPVIEHAHRRAPVPAAVGGGPPTREVHRHRHRHVVPLPEDPFPTYGRRAAFGIGMIHGIGAETPTQVLIFLAAAGASGKGAGLLLLGCFLVGLLSSNTAVALASTFGFIGASRNFGVYAAVSIVTAVFSLAMGTIFVLGQSTLLPAVLGG
jgi:hypothetical protein